METYDITEIVNKIIKGEKENKGFILEPATNLELSKEMQDHVYHSSESDELDKRPALLLYDEVGIVKQNSKISLSSKINFTAKSIHISHKAKTFNVSLFDLKGRNIYNVSSFNEKCSISRDLIGKGVFIIKISNNNTIERHSISLH